MNFSIGVGNSNNNYNNRYNYGNRITFNGGPKASIILGIIFAFLGVIVFGIGVNNNLQENKKSATYKDIVGTVVDMHTEQEDEYNDTLDRYETKTMYTPIYEYQINEVKYRYESNMSSSIKPTIGSTVTIKYNPNNPNDAYIEGEGDWLFLLVGGIFIVAGIFIAVTGFNQMNKQGNISETPPTPQSSS